jgi:uncharacterized membrane protein
MGRALYFRGVMLAHVYLFIHILFATILVGSNFFLELIFNRRLKLIPPASQMILSAAVGLDMAILNWIALIGLSISGLLYLNEFNMFWSLFSIEFYNISYGRTLLVAILIVVALFVNGGLMTFYYRPRLVRRLSPKEASEVDVAKMTTEQAKLSKRLAYHVHFNFIASITVLVLMVSLSRLGGIL